MSATEQNHQTVTIVKAALENDVVWPDELDYSHINSLTAADRNTIGCAFKNLRRQCILMHGTGIRESKAPGANSRTIFSWRLNSRARAELFMKRNGSQVTPTQQELIA